MPTKSKKAVTKTAQMTALDVDPNDLKRIPHMILLLTKVLNVNKQYDGGSIDPVELADLVDTLGTIKPTAAQFFNNLANEHIDTQVMKVARKFEAISAYTGPRCPKDLKALKLLAQGYRQQLAATQSVKKARAKKATL